MRTSTLIKERLQQNTEKLMAIQRNSQLSKVQQLEMEYLEIEAETFRQMLTKVGGKGWKNWLLRKWVSFSVVLLSLSFYVVLVFHMFGSIDLSKVQQWEFVVTAMPFWLMAIVVPIALVVLIAPGNRNQF